MPSGRTGASAPRFSECRTRARSYLERRHRVGVDGRRVARYNKRTASGGTFGVTNRTNVPASLREFIAHLRASGQLLEVEREVDPRFELNAVVRKVQAGPNLPILFKKVR